MESSRLQRDGVTVDQDTGLQTGIARYCNLEKPMKHSIVHTQPCKEGKELRLRATVQCSDTAKRTLFGSSDVALAHRCSSAVQSLVYCVEVGYCSLAQFGSMVRASGALGLRYRDGSA